MKTPLRVALFGSFYRGQAVLETMLQLRSQGLPIQIVGVATDDPSKPFTSPGKRVWQYPHAKREETMVADLASKYAVPVYTGRVKTGEFYDLFENAWQPDICYMATFGQLIDARLFEYPKFGFYNLHPSSDKSWPSYVGGNPFYDMQQANEAYCVITLHKVDGQFDHGKLVDVSQRIAMPKDATVPDMHRLSALQAASLVAKHLTTIIDSRPDPE